MAGKVITTEELLGDVKDTKFYEGWRSTIYDDPGGNNRAIGYGFNIDDPATKKLLPKDVLEGKRKLTKEEAEPIYQKKYNAAALEAKYYLGEDVFDSSPKEIQNVVTDMTYNLGISKILEFKKFKEAIKQKDWDKAAEELKNSKWYEQTSRRSKAHYKTIKKLVPKKEEKPKSDQQSFLSNFLMPSVEAATVEAPINKNVFSTEDLFGEQPTTTKKQVFSTEDLFGGEAIIPENSKPTFLSDAYNRFQAGLGGFNAAITRIPAALYDLAAMPQNFIAKTLGRPDLQVQSPKWLMDNIVAKGYDKVQQNYLSKASPKKDFGELVKNKDWKGLTESIALQVIENAPHQIGIIASYIGGVPALGLTGMGAISGTQALKEGRDKGADPAMNAYNALANGAIEAGFESIGTMGILKKWEGVLAQSFGTKKALGIIKDVAKTVIASMAGEGNEELLTSLAQDFSSMATGVDPNAMKGSMTRAVEAGLVGAASGGLMTAPTAIVSGRAIAKNQPKAITTEELVAKPDETAPTPQATPKQPIQDIIEQAGGVFRGLTKGLPEEGGQPAIPGIVQFDDPQTGSTLAMKENEITPELVKAKIEESRAKFAPKTPIVEGEWKKGRHDHIITNGKWDIETARRPDSGIVYMVKNNDTLEYLTYKGDTDFPDLETAKNATKLSLEFGEIKKTLTNLSTQDLEKLMDIRYEAGASQEELDMLETEYANRISEEDLGMTEEELSGASIETQLAGMYNRYVNPELRQGMEEKDILANMRSVLQDAGVRMGKFKGATDEQILAAAKDIYERKLDLIKRYKAKAAKQPDLNQSNVNLKFKLLQLIARKPSQLVKKIEEIKKTEGVERTEWFEALKKLDEYTRPVEKPMQKLVAKGLTQKEQVKKAISEKPKSIKEIADETKILEPNVRRIVGVGAKEGTFERVDKGVYVLKANGKDVAYIHTGDALEVLPKLVEQGFKADMIFLDIPYKTPAVIGGNRGIKFQYITPEQFRKVVESLDQIIRNVDTPIFYMYSQAKSGQKAMQEYNNIMTDYFEPVARGQYTKLQKDGITRVRNMRGDIIEPEAIVLFSGSGNVDLKTKPILNFSLVRPKGYQTEKPAEMLNALIKMSTGPGATVFDPFAGSGVAIEQAVKEGRKGVGIEISEDVVKKHIIPKVEKAVKEKTVKEGKTYEVYQGRGKPVEEIYRGMVKPVMGDANYYAFTAEDAKNFGTVTKKSITLKNSLTIDSDDQWRALSKEAGWAYPNLYGSDEQVASRSIDDMKKLILSKGYDSVIIKLSETDITKTLRKVFGVSQIIDYTGMEKVFNAPIKLTKEQEASREIKEIKEAIDGERARIATVERMFKEGKLTEAEKDRYIKEAKEEIERIRKYQKPQGGGGGGSMIAATGAAGTIGKGGYGTIESSEKAAERAKKGKIAKSDYSKVAEEMPVEKFSLVDEALKLASPSSRKGAILGKKVLRKNISELAHNDVVVAESLNKAHRAFTWLSKADTFDFIDRMETGQVQKTESLQKISVMFRGLLDGRRTIVQNLGKGHLENYIENYFPHIWKDPQKAKNVISQIMGNKRLEGTKSFLKKRVIITVKDGMTRGLELVSDNPVDLVLLKLHEIDRYIMAQNIIRDLKERGLIKFVYSRSKSPEGYVKVNDSAFTVFMPPEITKKDYFDQIMVDDLMSIAQSLGIDTKRFVSIGGKRAGYAQWFPGIEGGEKVRTKYASPESVLAHEIGHILGYRYNLYNLLGRRNEGEWKEHKKGKKAGQRYFKPTKEAVEYRGKIDVQWRALADARAKDIKVPQGYRNYLRKSVEKEAVMLEALMHAPEEFKRVAPDLYSVFTKFLNNTSELRPLLDIKPSLVLGTNDAKMAVPGFTTLGHYYATEPVGKLLNNYLSPGLRNNQNKIISTGYNMVRGFGNLLNQAQLSLSLFHGLNTTSDMVASTFGLGLRKLLTKGQRTKGLMDIISVPVSPIATVWNGQRIRKAYTKQLDTITDQKLRQMVEAIIAAGGRDRMDVFYYNMQVKSLQKTLSDIVKGDSFTKIKSSFKLPFDLFGATLEVVVKPLMEWYVPAGKIGMFAKLAQHEFERAESGQINQDQLWERLTQSWDSVDNRMGQLIYDNLFWNKTLKDTLMMSIRSVGWNLGSWREFTGAVIDMATVKERINQGDIWFSHRLAYTIGAVTAYSILGAIIQTILTGEPPEEAKDYLFPKTGKKNPDGSDERLSLPTYAKDWYAWTSQPVKTMVHKIHPLWGLVGDLATNEDYFNTEIRHTGDPLTEQAVQVAAYIGKSFSTISMKNYEKMEKATPDEVFRNVFVSLTGITSAPSYITRSPAQNLMTRYIIEKIPPKTKTKEQFERSAYRKTLKDRIRKGDSIDTKEAIDILGLKSYNSIKREAAMDPFADSFNRLSLVDALNVYSIANDLEKTKVKDILRSKYDRAASETKTPEVQSFYSDLMGIKKKIYTGLF